MEAPTKPTTSSLFEVYLRLRPSFAPNAERFLDVDAADDKAAPTHITIHPPAHDQRRKAVETFKFTRVFEEEATQLDLFHGTGLGSMMQGVLGAEGREGRDGLFATLGVTGSGKSHTILGSRSQRGLTQLALDVLYQNLGDQLISTRRDQLALQSIFASDTSEAHMSAANQYLESIYGDAPSDTRSHSRAQSRAATPLMVRSTSPSKQALSQAKPQPQKDMSFVSNPRPSSAMAPKRHMPRVSSMPQFPIIQDTNLDVDQTSEFAIVVSMYEVYNDRIFDLLAGSAAYQPSKTATAKRRHLLYKSTEHSPDRKVVAGLRKVVCENLDEALLVLETGLTERRVAGTGSNAVSSRSHGFFCVEVKKRLAGAATSNWSSSALTIVDLAGSERARAAKTAGSTLAEAGKINESLMYLGQCMQMQSDNADPTKASNIGIMIVTADPLGDYNATSQILRYSALAREVTVPRIPSYTSTMVPLARPGTSASGRLTPSNPAASDAALENALAELALLRQDLELAQLRLEEETQRRKEAESSWLTAENRLESLELELRDEIWEEFESQLESERRRYHAAREAEQEHVDQHLDKKLEILTRGLGEVQVREDSDAEGEEKIAELEEENARLREKVQAFEREKENQSPVRKMRVLKPRKWEGKEEFGVGLFGGSP
ncbi:P-loop containing nucleoside triphosphate hydrolase protein [Aureobasidium melanogenum CBS 110374]|uniref:p-loop containing nucleoside triphosphate hydrolase protein n=1 Tax=Aureobasidium melanogenum (strain CBS 110374) TaxID=1043003 RepID=A0A074VSG5_AURM1|nr:P-loop containing nucleoside triphosphate hydrolase protein [Aureobasidium melanogenum CBS 110374]KEQ63700.1 P-loop containing nucleoside triphosphate hydrolase protein [Aureobasidium melanogenum CBS 110374]